LSKETAGQKRAQSLNPPAVSALFLTDSSLLGAGSAQPSRPAFLFLGFGWFAGQKPLLPAALEGIDLEEALGGQFPRHTGAGTLIASDAVSNDGLVLEIIFIRNYPANPFLIR